jgi:hypothetical protein
MFDDMYFSDQKQESVKRAFQNLFYFFPKKTFAEHERRKSLSQDLFHPFVRLLIISHPLSACLSYFYFMIPD